MSIYRSAKGLVEYKTTTLSGTYYYILNINNIYLTFCFFIHLKPIFLVAKLRIETNQIVLLKDYITKINTSV